jgi:hypothetical protein
VNESWGQVSVGSEIDKEVVRAGADVPCNCSARDWIFRNDLGGCGRHKRKNNGEQKGLHTETSQIKYVNHVGGGACAAVQQKNLRGK